MQLVQHPREGSTHWLVSPCRRPFPKEEHLYTYMGVSLNGGTPKWMVYNGKPYQNHFRKPSYSLF